MRTIRGPCAKNFLSPKITNVSLRTPCMPGECQANKNKQSPTNNEIQARAIHAIPLPGGFQASTMRNFSVRESKSFQTGFFHILVCFGIMKISTNIDQYTILLFMKVLMLSEILRFQKNAVKDRENSLVLLCIVAVDNKNVVRTNNQPA